MIGMSLLPYNTLSPLKWAGAINDWDELTHYPRFVTGSTVNHKI